MVSIKLSTLVLLGLFTSTCFIAAAALHQIHGVVHQNGLGDTANDVAAPEGVSVVSAGKRKVLFGGRKLLEEVMDGRSYKNEGSKSSGKLSSLNSSEGIMNQLNFEGKLGAVAVSKSSSGSQNSPGLQVRSIEALNENKVQKLHNTASQLVNFMHKDYGGMDRPHRKPPIHNGEPFN